MNKSIIRYILGWVLVVEGAFMVLPLIVSFLYHEPISGNALIKVIAICWLIGFPIISRKPQNKQFYAKEGFVSVALSWVLLSVVGAMPFVWSQEIPRFVDAFFEVVSGFTTTGSSILTDVEAMSYTMLFWRSFTHWIGGMGVLVFILAVMPHAGGSYMHVMRAESPGPSVGKLVPRIKQTAVILYSIYVGMSIVQVVLMLLGGMSLFDSLTIMFGTAGTGGFAIKADSMGGYSTYLQAVVTIFMILFGVNFNAYFFIVIRKTKLAFRNEEVRWYLLIISAAIAAIAININETYGWLMAFHHAAFQVGSIITTTGYATLDFNFWPSFSKTILVLLMFIGACAGSTGGGLKVSRVVIMAKQIGREIAYLINRHSVKSIRFDQKVLDDDMVRSVGVYLLTYCFIFAGSIVLVSLDNIDLVSTFTAVATTINNVGPGLELVGPMGSFFIFSDLSKYVMSFDMLVGRLEIFPMLLLCMPSTWRRG